MSLSHSPKIVLTDLVFYIDPGNPKSYIDTTHIGDISKSNNDMTYLQDQGALVYDATTNSFDRTTIIANDIFRSANKVDLSGGFTINALIYAHTHANTNSANGVVSNHSYTQNSGGGINLKCVSTTDYRISCNTGNGSSRTFNTYAGTSNIKDKWAYCSQRYDDTNNLMSLWVNGIKEFEVSYTMYCIADYIDLFCWSTTHYTNTAYRPGVKINNVSVYNRDLTDSEMVQNFEALRGRFGI